MMKVCAVRTGM